FPSATFTLEASGTLTGARAASETGAFLDALDAWWQDERTDASKLRLPFRGGWLVFLGYELAAEIESRLELPRPAQGPIAQAIRIPAALIFEHESASAWILAEPHAVESIARI